MDWIDVKEKHFAHITKKEDSYVWESDMIDEPILVAVPTNKGWDIEMVVLTDYIGLECICNDEKFDFGWEMTDVTHWCKINYPKNNSK